MICVLQLTLKCSSIHTPVYTSSLVRSLFFMHTRALLGEVLFLKHLQRNPSNPNTKGTEESTYPLKWSVVQVLFLGIIKCIQRNPSNPNTKGREKSTYPLKLGVLASMHPRAVLGKVPTWSKHPHSEFDKVDTTTACNFLTEHLAFCMYVCMYVCMV